MRRCLFSILSAMALMAPLVNRCQEYDLLRSLGAGIDLAQVKEGLNAGLVYSGPQFRFNYRRSWNIHQKELLYQGKFSLGALTTRKMLGLYLRIVPADLVYHVYKKEGRLGLRAGPWFCTDYNYQLYPHQQSGYSFHFTEVNLGLAASVRYEDDDHYIRIRWKNSLFGLVSRPPVYRDPYFFELDLGTYFRDQNDVFKAGSFNLYNDSRIEVLYVNHHHPRLGYAYTFHYFTYSGDPQAKMLSHGFTVFFYPEI